MRTRLFTGNFVEPHWFNQVRSGIHEGVVKDGNKVEVLGKNLTMEKPLPVGKGETVDVFLSPNGFFYGRTKEEDPTDSPEQTDKTAAMKKKEDHLFNLSLNIPAIWVAEIKPVLSGLMENSWGDGSRRNTVVHVLLLEDLEEGRLSRSSGEYLCSPAKVNWKDILNLKISDRRAQPKVTCKACLKIASRWQVK